jgi:hypothetical protein
MTITRDAPTRSGMARNPIPVTARICLIPPNTAAPSPFINQSFYYFELLDAPSR